ncbi:ComF family protein [Candidatus Babeliales bacterium]|nr:ComF family protein [Candidatus Babeliales bacterium]
MRVKPFLNKFVSSIYPSYCWNCLKVFVNDSIFCDSCWDLINTVPSLKLGVAGEIGLNIFSAVENSEPLKKLLKRKNFGDVVASKHLARILLKYVDTENLDVDYLVPIPLHWIRYSKRGFNQAEVIAEHLGKILNIPVINLLTRVKRTKFQASLSLEKRQKNLKSAFSLNGKVLEKFNYDFCGKRLLLVDDLCVTGVTLQSAAKELIKLSPKDLRAVAVCRGTYKKFTFDTTI